MQTQHDAKFLRMTTEPVERLTLQLAVPTILSMLITAFYNLADTFFVRQLSEDSAAAAVGVVLPLMSLVQALGFFCGHGSGNYMSRAFGRRDYRDAESMAAAGFGWALLFGLSVGAAGLVFCRPLAVLLGAKTAATTAASISYMRWICIAAPFMTCSIVINNQLRMQGNAAFAMMGLSAGAVLNIVLDPIFIYETGMTLADGRFRMPFGLGLGVGGAALATCLSQAVSLGLLWICMLKSDSIRIRLTAFRPTLLSLRRIFKGGFPSLVRQGLAGIGTACINHAAGLYLDPSMIDAVQSAMMGNAKIMNLLMSALIGFGQGFQPVCGFNYGAKRYDRVIRAYRFCVLTAFAVLCVLSALGYFFAEPVTDAIAGTTPEAAEIACTTFRAQLLVFPLSAWIIMCNMLLQNMGMTAKATLTAMLRQCVTLVPCIFLLPWLLPLFGGTALLGLELAQTAADLLAFAISLPVGLQVLRQLKREFRAEHPSGTFSE